MQSSQITHICNKEISIKIFVARTTTIVAKNSCRDVTYARLRDINA